MTIKIGSNLASLNAQRKLGEAEASLSKVFERLSSGQRINRASDDAAGLAIADDLKAKGRIYTQAIRNGNDGISLLNIADSAIDALSGVVTRIRELSEQAANGTYSSQQRAALDAEAQALSKEFTRITQTTSFNGIKLFDGSLGSGVRLQLGIGTSESINASIGGAVGTGSFSNYLIFDTNTSGAGSAYSYSISLGDLNGDGILDMATAGTANNGVLNQGQASIRLGRGDGTFGDNLTFATNTSGTGNAQSYSLSLGDLNGDGVLDLVTIGSAHNGVSNQGQVSIRLGLGDGTFGENLTFETNPQEIDQSSSLSLGDLNGDGTLDLVIAGSAHNGVSNQGQASIRLGRGDGTFGDNLTFQTNNSGTGSAFSSSLSLGDLNSDGILDLVTAGIAFNVSSFQGQASIRLGRGDGTFGDNLIFETNISGSGAAYSNSLELGDLNGDGVLDLVTVGYIENGGFYQGQASIRLGLGDGTFGDNLTFETNPYVVVGTGSDSMSLGDLNGDGILDLVTAGYSQMGTKGQASIKLGLGDGTFGDNLILDTNSGTNRAASLALSLGDLNGDGVLDLVTAGYSQNGSSSAQGQASVLLANTEEGLGAMLDFSLKTKADALQSMGILDRTLENLAKQRGSIGASQSRIGTAINNLQTATENFRAAESRIRDADIAAESATLIRTQILQQAAASVLSQANQQPQIALLLLR